MTVVLLVLLRLNIGWHFYSEGVNHYSDPKWTSAAVLRAAKGPLASQFQSYLPEFADLQTLAAADDMKAVEDWLQKKADAMAVERQQFADFYQFDEKQLAAADALLKLRQDQIRSWGPANKEDLETFFHERERLANQEAEPAAKDVPFKKQRNTDKQAELSRQTRGWVTQLQDVHDHFRGELAALRTDKQQAQGLPPQPPTPLATVDKLMVYGIMGIGVCLLLGLFTRLACLLGAAFLVSVVLTQPFWVSEAQPTFNQWVEMIALLVLASTNVGKWGGLDFFLSCLSGSCCRSKSKQS